MEAFNAMEDLIGDVPADVLVMVFKMLDPVGLVRVCGVCRWWRHVARTSAAMWGSVLLGRCSHSSQVTDSVLQWFLSAMPMVVTQVDVERCKNLTSQSSAALGLCCKLRVLNIAGTCLVQSEPLAHLVQNCNSLQHLVLANSELDDKGLACLVGIKESLEYLDLGRCSKVTQQGFSALSQLCKLRHLYLRGSKIGSNELETIAHGCQDLRYLSIRGCKFVTSIGVHALSTCAHLKRLDLRQCQQFETNTIDTVVQKCERLLYLKIGGQPLMSESLKVLTLTSYDSGWVYHKNGTYDEGVYLDGRDIYTEYG
eukprot:m.60206 g.60206  ORF g.60206 m.60206 type:complete len:311 (+) comp22813_c0_seq1:219-1151(+)